jgi:hypothetical protein
MAPGTVERELVQRALNAIYGVDLNPYAVAIARFRMLLEALRASGIGTLKEAPPFRINVVVEDSLLQGARFGELGWMIHADTVNGVRGSGIRFRWRTWVS